MSFRFGRWFLWAVTIGAAVGGLAIMDKYLQGFPFTYDGPNAIYRGRTVTVQYCLLSSANFTNSAFGQGIRCRLGVAAFSVSLGISFLWLLVLILRRDWQHHPRMKLVDWALMALGVFWWVALGIALSAFSHQANLAGLPGSNWRNTICFLAWLLFIVFTILSLMSMMLSSARFQGFFDRKPKVKKEKLSRKDRKAAAAAQHQHQAMPAEGTAPYPAAAGSPVPTHGHQAPLPQSGPAPGAMAPHTGGAWPAAGDAAQPPVGGAGNPFLGNPAAADRV